MEVGDAYIPISINFASIFWDFHWFSDHAERQRLEQGANAVSSSVKRWSIIRLHFTVQGFIMGVEMDAAFFIIYAWQIQTQPRQYREPTPTGNRVIRPGEDVAADPMP